MTYPEKVIQAGNCRASIFMNSVAIDGKTVNLPKTKIEVRYKDKRDGKWQGTNSLTIHEIPKAILVFEKAYEYLICKKQNDTTGQQEA